MFTKREFFDSIREIFAFLRLFFITFYIILFIYISLFLLQVNIEIKYRKYRLLQVLKMLFIVLLLFNLHHLKIEICTCKVNRLLTSWR